MLMGICTYCAVRPLYSRALIHSSGLSVLCRRDTVPPTVKSVHQTINRQSACWFTPNDFQLWANLKTRFRRLLAVKLISKSFHQGPVPCQSILILFTIELTDGFRSLSASNLQPLRCRHLVAQIYCENRNEEWLFWWFATRRGDHVTSQYFVWVSLHCTSLWSLKNASWRSFDQPFPG